MKDIILIIDVLSAVVLIGLILLQQGKGADMGAAFGSGASQTLFGSRGSANFLTRTTAILGTVFFISNLALLWIYSHQSETASVTKSVVIEQPVKSDMPPVPGAGKAPEVPSAPKLPEVPK